MNNAFWKTMSALLSETTVVIDRPKHQPHPNYPELIYPLDYGYLAGTVSGDGDGIDVWLGTLNPQNLTGILCTFDTVERDAEIKLLAGCSAAEVETILNFYGDLMQTLYIPKPKEL